MTIHLMVLQQIVVSNMLKKISIGHIIKSLVHLRWIKLKLADIVINSLSVNQDSTNHSINIVILKLPNLSNQMNFITMMHPLIMSYSNQYFESV